MLVSLHVENFAIIDVVDVDFKDGLSIITGETGAGKSLIIDAISLLSGQRCSSSIVRPGTNKAIIEGVFCNLSNNLLDILQEYNIEIDDDLLILRRDIYSNGKSIYRINGLSVNLNIAEVVFNNLVDIHMQNDTMGLFNDKNYLSFIDDKVCIEKLTIYQSYLKDYKEELKRYNDLIINNNEINNDFDYLHFQYSELQNAHLKNNEVEPLEAELKQLNNYEDIYSLYNEIKNVENTENLEESIYQLFKILQKLQSYNPKYNSYTNNIENAYYDIKDLFETISVDFNSLDFNEERLNEINNRLDLLSRLTKKYHRSIDELIAYQDKLKNQLDDFENRDYVLNESLKLVKEKYYLLKNAALDLSNLRKTNAIKLEENIVKTLKDLMLEKVNFKIYFEPTSFSDELNSKIFDKNGIDKIDFLISFNAGQKLQSLNKVASGGEISRTMLALKSNFYINKHLSTVIFDEIDTGMSGKVAEVVAKKLKEMSKSMQVLAITHLPIVASEGDNQLFVSKITNKNMTLTCIKELSYEERIKCLAEMISPSDKTNQAIIVAQNMLKK